jgi:hypothetical protein
VTQVKGPEFNYQYHQLKKKGKFKKKNGEGNCCPMPDFGI